MDGYTWYAIIVGKDGKKYSHAFRLSNNQNIVAFIRDYSRDWEILAMNAFNTKKDACYFAKGHNEWYKEQGIYPFDSVFYYSV